MNAAALEAQVKRLTALIDGLRRETEYVQAGGLGLSQVDGWNHRDRLHKAMGQLEDARMVLAVAADRLDANDTHME